MHAVYNVLEVGNTPLVKRVSAGGLSLSLHCKLALVTTLEGDSEEGGCWNQVSLSAGLAPPLCCLIFLV